MRTRQFWFATTAIVAALAAGTAAAHPGMAQGMGHGLGMGQGMGHGMHRGMGTEPGKAAAPMAATLEQRLQAQKSALQITGAQESAWTAYAAVLTRQVEARNNMREKMHAQMAPGTALPDRAAMHETMQKLQQELATQRTAAVKDLYAVLSPEQKALADQQLGGRGGQRMAGPMGRGMGGQMGGQMGGHHGHGMGGRQ